MHEEIEVNPHMERLNTRQRKFVREYILRGDATEAYLAAGYARKSKCKRETARKAACSLMKNPDVQAAIAWEQAQIREQYGIDKDWVVKHLVAVLEDSTQKVLVKIGGNMVSSMKDRRQALGALKLLGNTCDAFTEHVQHGLSEELQEIFKSAAGTGTPPVRDNLEVV